MERPSSCSISEMDLKHYCFFPLNWSGLNTNYLACENAWSTMNHVYKWMKDRMFGVHLALALDPSQWSFIDIKSCWCGGIFMRREGKIHKMWEKFYPHNTHPVRLPSLCSWYLYNKIIHWASSLSRSTVERRRKGRNKGDPRFRRRFRRASPSPAASLAPEMEEAWGIDVRLFIG